MPIEDCQTYQQASRTTWSVIGVDHTIVSPALGLASEAGKVVGTIETIVGDKSAVTGEADRQVRRLELGDGRWYLTQICTELDLSLAEVAVANVAKLAHCHARSAIGGDGDER